MSPNTWAYTVQNIPDNYPVTNLSFWFMVDDSLVPRNGHVNLVYDSTNPEFDPSVIQSLNTYAFSDGYLSLSPMDGRQMTTVSFDTDAYGNVSGNWNVDIGSRLVISMGSFNYVAPNGGRVVEDYSMSSSHPFVIDPITGTYSPSAPGGVFVYNNPGTWTRSFTTTVPLPGGMLLFGSVFYCFGISRYLRPRSDWVRRFVSR